jgi:uncharacterized protein (TIGR02217 family)
VAFKNIRFPTGIRFGAVGGPAFKTGIAQAISGKTKRNANWSPPLRKYQVARACRTDALRQSLLSFFMVAEGRANTWRLKDPFDFEVAITEGVFSSLGSGRYQMVKRYSVTALTAGSPTVLYTYDVDILLPVSGTIVVTGKTENTDYSIDYTAASGVLTLLGSPTGSAPVSWSGEYDVHARFDVDELQFTAQDRGEDGIIALANNVPIVEELNTA